ncbi:MAG: hypothetical protein IBX50_17795 [Marinospirillum sp.]|uniref:hypothetical protein n=1 Tax=Marinospirillum sp. TaxID=2183934 RepID=UPI0019F0B8E5|nr:hypothetical protein [Marinospirillum sp.]MBE0508541.1 hypothetical protein [Marinospirillum sp.]
MGRYAGIQTVKKMKILIWMLLLLLLTGCSNKVEDVPLMFLVTHASSFDGRQVQVSGVVRGLAEPEHYWLEDEQLNRVGLHPASAARAYLDQTVMVTGRFSADRSKGRHLRGIRVLSE